MLNNTASRNYPGTYPTDRSSVRWTNLLCDIFEYKVYAAGQTNNTFSQNTFKLLKYAGLELYPKHRSLSNQLYVEVLTFSI